MKIQLASDLHLEHLEHAFEGQLHGIIERTEADVLVLAGDIHSRPERVAELFKDAAPHVIYVAGNHEFYGSDWSLTRDRMRQVCDAAGIHFLDDRELVIDGVRFLGTTLWTDFVIDGFTVDEGMSLVSRALNDFRVIRNNKRTFSPMDAFAAHKQAVNWLQGKFAEPFEGKTVVVSHHGPHWNSVHPKYRASGINGGFSSQLPHLLAHADYWLHGHTHDSFDYKVEGCRVLANPHGYPMQRWGATVRDIKRENPAFDPALTFEVS